MVFERFSSLTGVLTGAKELVVLNVCPSLLFCSSSATLFFILGGLGGSLINTRAIMPFLLCALIFLENKEIRGWKLFVFMFFAFAWMSANVIYLFMAFRIKGGIQ